MLFNSIDFLIFFPIVALLYFLLPHKLRWALLLAASCLFYMAFEPRYILLCVYIIGLDYCTGLLLSRTEGRKKTTILIISLILSFLPLFFYKYFNFFSETAARIGTFFGLSYGPKVLDLLLPVGISFLTFQSFGYCFDVYRGGQAPERRPHIFALFVMFFPQLVAGPIERSANLLAQFDEVHRFDSKNLTVGLRHMLWGMFKKMVVADQLALVVNAVYNNPASHGGGTYLLATVFFAFQIYCDFSGYSDIAIGAARILGFRLMENFRRPYFSLSVPEFWRRWHISLSSWFRDYLYFPMGGSRCKPARRDLNLLVTFGVSGLWHGAGFTFIIWGLLNGIYQVIGLHTKKLRDRLWQLLHLDRFTGLRRAAAMLCTFVLICVSWVFFRANSMTDAMTILSGICTDPLGGLRSTGLTTEILIGFFAIAALLFADISIDRETPFRRIFTRRPIIRWAVYLLLCIMILGLGVSANESQFIYFQF